MGNLFLIAVGGLSALVATVSAGNTILPRTFASCGFVGGQIYCWGGDTSDSLTSGFAIDQSLYSLNIAQFSGQTTDSMSNKWEKVVPAAPYDVGPRRTPTAIVLPDKKRFMINGGHDMNYSKLANQTSVYDTTTNTWSSVLPYSVANSGTRQIYFSTAVNLPNQLVGFYGGNEQVANISAPIISASGVAMPFDSSNGSVVGFTEVQMYAPEAKTWAPFSPQTNPPANYYPNSQTATIDPESGKVYYLGGSYYTPSGGPIRAPFSWGYTFNTKTGAWTNETFTGAIPTDRLYHSADLLPNSRDIILFGGTNDGKTASLDNCYTLNLLNNTWTKQDNVNVPSQLFGNRFAHSSVLVNNTLFFLFGKGLNGNNNPSMFTIDVTSVTNISYVSIFNAATDAVVPPNNNATNGTTDSTGPIYKAAGLSKGVVGGIAAGCVVLGLGLAACFVFCLRKKRRAAKYTKNENERDEANSETLHVDWDKIDNQYREVPPVVGVVNSPHSTNSEYTKVGSPPVEHNYNFTSSSRAQQYSPNLIETHVVPDSKFSLDNNTYSESPHTLDTSVVKPSVAGNDHGYSIVKPDGN